MSLTEQIKELHPRHYRVALQIAPVLKSHGISSIQDTLIALREIDKAGYNLGSEIERIEAEKHGRLLSDTELDLIIDDDDEWHCTGYLVQCEDTPYVYCPRGLLELNDEIRYCPPDEIASITLTPGAFGTWNTEPRNDADKTWDEDIEEWVD